MALTVRKRRSDNGKYVFIETKIKNEQDLLRWINSNLPRPDSIPYIRISDGLKKLVLPMIKDSTVIGHKRFFMLIIGANNNIKFKSQLEFWTNRGYTENEAHIKVAEFQSISSNEFAKKRKENPERYNDILPNQIGYWIKLGYTDEEAVELVRERQTTFSLDKCIEKYGEIEGLQRWEARQAKWQKSRLASLNEGLWDTESQGVTYKKWEEVHGDNWIVELFNSKKEFQIKSSHHKFYELVINHKNELLEQAFKLEWDDFIVFSSLGIVSYVLKTSKNDLIEAWLDHHDISYVKGIYSNRYWKNGKYYASKGELSIGMYLESLNIDFDTNIRYPNSKRIADFYIPALDLYIEYMGMDDDTYILRKNELKEHKIIWSSNIAFIKNKIHEKIYKQQ